VTDQWDGDMVRALIKFVTGSDRLPLPGTELIKIDLPFVAVNRADHQRHLGMLPQVGGRSCVCVCVCVCGWVGGWVNRTSLCVSTISFCVNMTKLCVNATAWVSFTPNV
jgi:hypothetical protein